MIKIMIVFGTRPETIKLAPVIKELKKYPKKFEIFILVSGQHNQMLEPFLSFYKIKPNQNLKIMTKNQSIGHIFSEVFIQSGKIIQKFKPDYLMVQGDTTTAAAAAWAAFLAKVKIAHLEAGLRTGDFADPYPEEANRVIIDRISDALFAPTKSAIKNLESEGIEKQKIFLTGNTVIDHLKTFQAKKKFDCKKIILLTLHRRESFGQPLENVLKAIVILAKKFPNFQIVFPIHFNPNVRKPAEQILGNISNVDLIEPLRHLSLLKLLNKSFLVLTDSGGVIEEAAYLGRPVLVLREKTERIESIKKGVAILVGRDEKKIVSMASELILDQMKRKKMTKRIFDYGYGDAARNVTKYFLNLK
ncbi:MAG: UDP-N-acetylglucosamine 2-epimerase (non-hydrolyzing) [Patescibacteria group bacterium]|jgi:UDP-N-acetylglucosamine 2-epimerase (non-hydrolysing)